LGAFLSTVWCAFDECCSVVVDKDQNPKWNPAHIEDVTQEKLDWYFSPLPDAQQELILPD